MLKYYRDGVPIVENSGTAIKTEAKKILRLRESDIEGAGACPIVDSAHAFPEIVLSMPTISCPECAATDVVKEQHLGSEILWFICAACRNVWCAINPRLSRPVDGGAER